MSGQPGGIVRSYTGARRHPWVLGKLGDWVMWFGPYTPAQLVVLGGGALLLIRTFSWWSWAGPVPVVLWLVSVWAVRGAQIAGQNPFTALLGAVLVLTRHPAGRIRGRVARDRAPSYWGGRFVIEPAPALAAAPSAVPVREAVAAATQARAVAGVRVAGSGLDRLLAGAAGGGRAAA
ncbi:hypothetical protein OHS33_36930 [Streptomyces sp. NBC_00536]|uniref:hypothetical protein n=1 Tax=Streptomyces sp. NBC_00536 TaxID=2975769 RepID=UPI002E821EA3|nr:hypothetical protein [Streptomyces sp. NBC_00536]WUC83455.1 hypothetical protein OHS33_36930 [Streptomyces sp. NBC_00536]